jgi:F5/8 type C domain
MAYAHRTRWGVAIALILAVFGLATPTAASTPPPSPSSTSSSTTATTTTTTATATTTTTTATTATSTTSTTTSTVEPVAVVVASKSEDDSSDQKKDDEKKDEEKKDEDKDKGDGLPVAVTARSWSTTGNSRLGAQAADGNPATEFVTQMLDWAPPTWAWLKADLGGNVPLTRVEWMWSTAGAADAFTLEVSAGNGRWVAMAQPGEAPVGQWTGVTLERETRFVRFSWRNPRGDAQLGHLAEVRFFARPGFEADGKGMGSGPADTGGSEGSAGPTTPTTKGDHWVVQHSSRSSNSPEASSRLPLDGDVTTAWQTALSVAPRTGWTLYDLGNVVAVPAIKWKFSQVGSADRFLIQTSTDGARWSTLAEQGNADAPDTWVRLDAPTKARFVRFYFTNPNGDPNIGFLSEVRFLHP